jgi:hypothetical protein
MFRYRNKLGEDLALEGLKEYLRRRGADLCRLLRYAEVFRVKKLITPDLKILAQNQTFQKGTLRQAIENTFRQRRTDLENRRLVFSPEFMSDAQREKDWKRFLERNEMESPGSFESIMNRIREFPGICC